jgi:uncharacterized caspase-like protein
MMHARRLLYAVLLVALWLPTGARADDSAYGRYYALVVGNNDYAHLDDLKTPVNDASVVADLLRRDYGFEVELMLNATREDLVSAFNRLRHALTPNDNLLIYYAGHGFLDEITDTGYWLPVDADPANDVHWIANDTITRHVRGMAAKHVLVVADSCYSGTLTRGAEVGLGSGAEREAFIARMAQKRSRTAMTSGGLEPVSDSGGDGHSIFARQFINALRTNDEILDTQSLYGQIRQSVVLNADQTPSYNDIRKAGHEDGDFLFVPTGLDEIVASTETGTSDNQPAGSAVRGSDASLDALFWESIKDTDDPANYEAYLEEFPDGTFARLAKLKLRQLSGTPPAVARSKDTPPPAPADPVSEEPPQIETVAIEPDPAEILRPTNKTPRIGGEWNTSFGRMTFPNVSNGAIEVPYPTNNGRIVGQLEAGRFSGIWAEPESESGQHCTESREGTRAWGRTELVFDDDVTRFIGRWSYCNESPNQEWVGALVSAAPVVTIGGTWSTSFGVMTFPDIVEGPVRAPYQMDSGRILGEFDGSVLNGYWIEAGSAQRCDTQRDGSYYWGRVRYLFNDDLNSFTGMWGYCEAAPEEGWIGQKDG